MGKGSCELHCKYRWLNVRLTYKSVFITPSIRVTVTSKKLIKVFHHSAVNFLVGWPLLILSINYLQNYLFSPCSHEKNMPSSYLHHKYGLCSDSFIISCSRSVINKMLYGCADLVPIAVPCFNSSLFFPNVSVLFFNTTFAKSITVSVEIYFSFRFSSHFADRPCSCRMSGYNPRASIVHKIMSSGNFRREQSFFRNSLVSLIYDFTD